MTCTSKSAWNIYLRLCLHKPHSTQPQSWQVTAQYHLQSQTEDREDQMWFLKYFKLNNISKNEAFTKCKATVTHLFRSIIKFNLSDKLTHASGKSQYGLSGALTCICCPARSEEVNSNWLPSGVVRMTLPWGDSCLVRITLLAVE